MKIREIVNALERFAPLSLQDSYDNAGLQIGLTVDADSTGALLCLDVTEDIIDEAASKGCNIIISHHPLLFRPCKTISEKDYIGRCIIKAIQKGISIYSAHTNLDSAVGGVNYRISEKLGLENIKALHEKPGTDGAGEGVTGMLPSETDSASFIEKVKATFNAGCVRHNNCNRQIKKVALCGGAGAFLINDAIEAGADAFLTGEIGYHRFFGYEDNILLLEIGHYESEQYTIGLLHDILKGANADFPIYEASATTNPISYR